MDIRDFLRNSKSSGSEGSGNEQGSVSSENSQPCTEGGRGAYHHQKRIAVVGTAAERRALRASETKDRSAKNREQQYEKKRAFTNPSKVMEEEVETQTTKHKKDAQVEKTLSRREKLEKFRAQKAAKKEEELKKKRAKPAFKAGFVHHPLAPYRAAEVPEKKPTRTNVRTTATRAAKTKMVSKPRVPPKVVVTKHSSSSGSGSSLSFAPDNFKFDPNFLTSLDMANGGSNSSANHNQEEQQSNRRNSSEEVKERAARPRTRSRRYSGVQPDLNIPMEELTKTPAEVVKERSRSNSRPRKENWYVCCPDEEKANHHATVNPPDEDITQTPAKARWSPAKSKTPMRTPRMSRISRKSVLPVVSESSPSQTESEQEEQQEVTMVKGRLSTLVQSSAISEDKTLAPNDTSTREDTMVKRRRSTRVQSNSMSEENTLEPNDISTRSSRRSSVFSLPGKISEKEFVKGICRKSTMASNGSEPSDTVETMDTLEPASVVDSAEPINPIDEVNLARRRSTRKSKTDAMVVEPNFQAGSSVMNDDVFSGTSSIMNDDVYSETTMDNVFKTPLPEPQKKIYKKAKSTTRKLPLPNSSPLVPTHLAQKRKRYSLSETKPKSSIYSMFDDIPGEGSPFHELMAKKFRSCDDIEGNSVEEIVTELKCHKKVLHFGNRDDNVEESEHTEIDITGTSTEISSASSTEPSNKSPEAETDEVGTTVTGVGSGSVIESGSASGNVSPTGQEAVVVAHARSVVGQQDCEHDVAYFRNLLVSETERITGLCDSWDSKLELDIPEDAQGQIRTVVGQGRLVMAQRFKQFSGLVDNCEYGSGEKTTSCMDLQGFWEMIYYQVEDVEKKFDDLKKLEENDWKEKEPVRVPLPKKVLKRKTANEPTKKKPSVSGIRAQILAKRKEAQLAAKENSIENKTEQKDDATDENTTATALTPSIRKLSVKDMIATKRAEMQKNVPLEVVVSEHTSSQSPSKSDDRQFDGGFFCIKSPARNIGEDNGHKSPKKLVSPTSSKSSTGGDRLRRAVLTDSARKVGLVSPYVSQMARRSINNEAIPENRTRRSTLFDDLDDDEDIKTPSCTANTVDNVELDVVLPMSSPVTKTYSKSGGSPHTQHEQKMDVAFDLLVSTAEERNLDKETTETPMTTPASAKAPKSKGRHSVKFSKSESSDAMMPQSVIGTPHPKHAPRVNIEADENMSPNVGRNTELESSPAFRQSRVSLLPGMAKSPALAAEISPSENLMSFSPVPATRRSIRLSSAQKK